MENIGARLVRQAASKTNDLAGDGTTTSVVLAQGLITEGVKVCVIFVIIISLEYYISCLLLYCFLVYGYFLQVVAAGANPIQISRGIETTTKALVSELKSMSKEVNQDVLLYHDLQTLNIFFKKNEVITSEIFLICLGLACRLKTVN